MFLILNKIKEMKFCPECNKLIEGELAACPFCGQKLEVTTVKEPETVILEPLEENFELKEGLRFCNRYRLERFIGRGGMGEVWKAFDEVAKEDVALKFIKPELVLSPEYIGRMEIEAKCYMKLTHPNILRLYNIEREEISRGRTIYFLVMELLNGPDLKQVIQSRKNSRAKKPSLFSDNEIAFLARQICPALSYAHSENIIHRDLKPSNLILNKQLEDMVHCELDKLSELRVKITDFGVARIMLKSKEDEGKYTTIGTPSYMSPEQKLGKKTDHRSDIYSLGCIFYECILGELPPAEPDELEKTLSQVGVSERLRRLIKKCLETEPDNRYQNAEIILKELAEPTSTITEIKEPKVPLKEVVKQRSFNFIYVLLPLICILGLSFWIFFIPKKESIPIPTPTPIIPVPTPLPQIVEIEGESVAGYESAIEDALRNAVRQGAGVFIQTQSEVENFRLIRDAIFSRANGYVKKYDVLSKHQKEDGTFVVRVKAVVSDEEIKDDWAGLQILIERKGRPNILIVASVESEPEQNSAKYAEVLESKFTDYFESRDFYVVQPQILKEKIRTEQERALLFEDEKKATALALQLNAPYVILTKLFYHSPIKKNIYGVETYYTRLELRSRLYEAESAQILADKFMSTEVASTRKENVVKEGLERFFPADDKKEVKIESPPGKILDRLVYHWAKDLDTGRKTTMLFTAVPEREINNLLNALRNVKQPGIWIKGINVEEINSRALSRISIFGTGITTEWLADKVAELAGKKFIVARRTAHSIEIIPLGYKNLKDAQEKQITEEQEQLEQHEKTFRVIIFIGKIFQSWRVIPIIGSLIILLLIMWYVFIIKRRHFLTILLSKNEK